MSNKYEPLESSEIMDVLAGIHDSLDDFFKMPEYDYVNWPIENWSVEIDDHALIDVIIRVHKRKAYYSYFHGLMQIDERKEGGLMAYWLIKLRPITLLFKDKNKADSKHFWLASIVNEAFATFIILAACIAFYDAKNIEFSVLDDPKKSFVTNLVYSFRYSNISIDAMMLLVETITPELINSGPRPRT
jgi:hypothetical protein